MVFVIAKMIHWVFLIYTILLLGRVIGSWFPAFSDHKLMRFVAFYTDPYLNMFRRVIPPIGGVLDLSPLIGFFALQIAENLLLFIIVR